VKENRGHIGYLEVLLAMHRLHGGAKLPRMKTPDEFEPRRPQFHQRKFENWLRAATAREPSRWC
jgi:hypothetical protein